MKLEKKLNLNRETIKPLNPQEENQVQGGRPDCTRITDTWIKPNSIIALC